MMGDWRSSAAAEVLVASIAPSTDADPSGKRARTNRPTSRGSDKFGSNWNGRGEG